ADALHSAALELALDVRGMQRLARVLRHRVPQDRHAAGLRIDFQIDQVRAEARARALGVDAAIAADRATGLAGDLREIGDGHRLDLPRQPAGRPARAVLDLDLIRLGLPELAGPRAELGLDLLGRFHDRHRARERRAAAAGEEREAERAGVADDRAHLLVRDAELVGGHVGERGAQSADVGRARHQGDGSVLVDRQRRAGLAADVEPEPGGDAAALPLAEWRVPVLGLLDRVERLFQTERAELRTIRGLGTLASGVHHAQLDPVDPELLGDLVDHAFDRELGDGGAGRAVSRHLRTVGDDVVADDLDVLHVVRRV